MHWPCQQTDSGSQAWLGQSSSRHAPWTQDSVSLHAAPQPPQFASSVIGSTHAPPQMRRPDAHTQVPSEQVSPVGHTTPTHALSVHAFSKHTDDGSQAAPSQLVG